MALTLSSPVTELPRIGPAKAKFLAKLGITHARDFLYTFPRRYDDFSRITPIGELTPGERQTVRARVVSVKSHWGFRGRQRMLRIFVELADDTGTLQVVWYNLRFLIQQLTDGRELLVAGAVEQADEGDGRGLRMRSPVIEFVDAWREQLHAGRIVPVYPETFGVTSRFLRLQVKTLLPLLQRVPEYVPAEIRERNDLLGIHEAVQQVHFPENQERLEAAQRRLRFDELFFLQLAGLVRRRLREERAAPVIGGALAGLPAFTATLPFALTSAQVTALQDIAADIERPVPMNRLLQGDVGSGKSVVALGATQATLAATHAVVYLAPTELLARQQALRFAEQLGEAAVALLVGSLTERAKEQVKHRLAAGEALCVVGTHALLQDDVVAPQLGLVIVDEQHRFGVAQRKALQERVQGETVPHLLSMTATPIPRTLNLTVYGDLDVSILDEVPPGRQPIETTIVAPGEREAAIVHILRELHAGRQAYVVAPLIEKSARLEVKSATETYEEMQQLFPDIAVGLLHGQLSAAEKDGVLRNFAAGALQLLVATAVVEVGIDVPNATIMIIEGAERFGLAQLHQFRGRVGRGVHQSYCYLFPTTETGATSRRLRVLERTTDGFVIAEEDLKLRGPGELYGVAQSGFGDLQVASLLDYELIKRVRAEAARVLERDPELESYPILKAKVAQKNALTHFE